MTPEQFFEAVLAEVEGARKEFPESDGRLGALVEEVGEVSKAVMYEPWGNVTKEAVQLAAMCLRLIQEGDPIWKHFRYRNVHWTGVQYMAPEHTMPHQFCTHDGECLKCESPHDGITSYKARPSGE